MFSALSSKNQYIVKKNIHILLDLKNRGLPYLIYFNPNQTIIKKPDGKKDSIKVDIKTYT